MAERAAPQVYSIAAHRGFADALVAGLVPRYAEPEFGLARLTLLLPSRRAERTLSEAFIRHYGTSEGQAGLLLPRMAVVGDLDLDETLGPLLDPLEAGSDILPACDPTFRWLRLAELIRVEKGAEAPRGAALLRLAAELAQGMDRLGAEGIVPDDLLQPRVLDAVGDLTKHWEDGVRLFAKVQTRWVDELTARGEIDSVTRRNQLFEAAAKAWREAPPPYPIVAAGVTSAAPALAKLLRVVSELPRGAVILPDLDLSLDPAVWDELGVAGAPAEPAGPLIGQRDAVTHPQYHLKLLLNRMGVNPGEVEAWHRAGLTKGPPERSHAISSLFMPPNASKAWAGLAPEKRRLAGVRVMQAANPEEEAQAIALLLREVLEVPEKRAALVTPDRGLAGRVVAHLRRWNIAADDTAGKPLSQSAAGRVLLLLAEVLAERAAPVPLLALLEHPLVAQESPDARASWLEQARALELALRGPRPAAGLAPISARLAGLKQPALLAWWEGVAAKLAKLMELAERENTLFADQLDVLAATGEELCGIGLWGEADGRALAALVEDLRLNARQVGTLLSPAELHVVLRERMDAVAVRPPWGGHPRIAIYGLLEARMSRADLVICGGLNEGSWPQAAALDPLLAPPVLRALGVPAADFRIGLAAHDLAGMLGAPEVVLSRAARDLSGPAIPSRFLLRVEALLGERLLAAHRETRAIELARALDDAPPPAPYPRPAPDPSAEQRLVDVSVTALDRLRSDPYQFYAQAILGLRRLDGLDEPPSPAWQGIVAHEILERWHRHDGDLKAIAEDVLHEHEAHPLMRALWLPRLLKALEWVAAECGALEGRRIAAACEAWGELDVLGVRIRGRADRIDVLSDGTLAIVDYKTGTPPSAKLVERGFSLQLGLVGLMAQAGGIKEVKGEPLQFEYWSLAKSRKSESGFGYRSSPVKAGANKATLLAEDFLDHSRHYLTDALRRWIIGREPFTARLEPDLPLYSDYDQLMRLEEWFEREGEGE